MLGSIQEDLLNLQGLVGSSTVDTQGLITGGYENLGAQLDTLTGQTQQSLSDLQANLTQSSNTNTQTVLAALQTQGDALATLIGSNQSAQAAYNQTFSDAIAAGFSSFAASHNAELAAITALGQSQGQANLGLYQTITSGFGQTLAGQQATQTTLTSGLGQIYAGQQAIRGDITGNKAYFAQGAAWAAQANPPGLYSTWA